MNISRRFAPQHPNYPSRREFLAAPAVVLD